MLEEDTLLSFGPELILLEFVDLLDMGDVLLSRLAEDVQIYDDRDVRVFTEGVVGEVLEDAGALVSPNGTRYSNKPSDE